MPLFRNAPRVLVLVCSCLQLATTSAFQSGLPAHNVGHQNNPSWNKIPRSASTGEKIGSFRNSEIGYRRQVTRIAAATTDDDSGKGERRAALLGTLVLLTVPLSWGTYVPVVRYLYKIEPPVPGFVFSACYYALAAVTTSFLARQFQSSASITSSELDEDDFEKLADDSSIQSIIPFSGGIELGMYLFVANCLQVIGLQTVESDRAGFLVQLTTVMVPICEGIFAGSVFLIPARTWVACVMAFLGLCVMGLDGKSDLIEGNNLAESLNAVALSLSQGDLLILGAAVLYTLHVVRLGTYARQTTPMKLAASKATTESILSVALIILLVGMSSLQDTYHLLDVSGNEGLLAFSVNTGREITSFFSSFTAGLSDGSLSTSVLLPAFGAILWTGWITCAYTIWAQSFGQSKVSPTSANLVYTFQPIFTALFAYFLLGEKMGPVGFLGGSIIATSVYVVASNEGDNSETNTVESE